LISEKNHIAILCSRLDLPGGIERAIVNAANLFAQKANKVAIIILDTTGKSFYPVHPSIQIIQQPLSFGITTEGNIISRKLRLLSDVLKLKRIIKNLKADVVISTEYPFTVAAALARAKKYTRLYSWEHHHHAWLQKNKFWTFLCKQAYPKLSGIICLNKTEAEYYKDTAPSFVIPNFIENRSGELSSCTNKTILSVGWLIPRKGIDLMLQAAKTILTAYPDWTWKLIGEGEMKEQVEQFIQTEKLEGRFILQAPVNSEIMQEYLNASIYVMSSRFEAFPMVLLEAMSVGLPCVSFDCPSGPSDIITNNIDGIIVEKENINQLTTAILTLITSEEKRKEMGEAAFINVQRFSPDNIYELWKQLFK
jgi:glycosyltransferase involved in cell wall biosynthesis